MSSHVFRSSIGQRDTKDTTHVRKFQKRWPAREWRFTPFELAGRREKAAKKRSDILGHESSCVIEREEKRDDLDGERLLQMVYRNIHIRAISFSTLVRWIMCLMENLRREMVTEFWTPPPRLLRSGLHVPGR
jgi:transcriptional regulator NrdR family protein